MNAPPRRFRCRPDDRGHRPGFTLVELLVVITILGVLVALLVPVIWSAVRTANNTRVGSEINTLASALEQFKLKYGDYPPSRIILKENGAYNVANPPAAFYGATPSDAMNYAPNASYAPIGGSQIILGTPDLNYEQLATRSIQTLRKLWPRVTLTTGPGLAPGTIPGGFYDFNGNRQIDNLPIYLQGHECLVFFLGGIPNHDVSPAGYTLNGVLGFGNNPRNPFRIETVNREDPLFEFQADRLVDDDFDGIPGFVDTLGTGDAARYFAYFSSYNGAGYDPNDVNFNAGITEQNVPSGVNASRPFRVSYAYPGNTPLNVTTSPLPNPYTTGLPLPNAGAAAAFASPQSFQIISAGQDRAYGVGGRYDASGNQTRLPADPPIPEQDRLRDRDNITSFTNGPLE